MAIWRDLKGNEFNDGLKEKPGEEGFTRELASAFFKNEVFNYVGTPDWVPQENTEKEK